jgi:hypothetical protein
MPTRVAARRSLKLRKHVRIWFEAQNRAAKADIPAQLARILACVGSDIDHAVDPEMGNKAAERNDLTILVLAAGKPKTNGKPAIA